MEDETLTAEQVSRRLFIQPETVRRGARAGKIPHLRLGPKVIRFFWPDVVKAMRSAQHDEEVTENEK